MAERLAGKAVADAMKEDLVKKVEKLKEKGIVPKLGIVRIGARPDDLFYEGGAKKTCDTVGMKYEVFEYPADIDLTKPPALRLLLPVRSGESQEAQFHA